LPKHPHQPPFTNPVPSPALFPGGVALHDGLTRNVWHLPAAAAVLTAETMECLTNRRCGGFTPTRSHACGLVSHKCLHVRLSDRMLLLLACLRVRPSGCMFSLSVCLSVCLSVVFPPSRCLSIYLHACMHRPPPCVFAYLPVCRACVACMPACIVSYS